MFDRPRRRMLLELLYPTHPYERTHRMRRVAVALIVAITVSVNGAGVAGATAPVRLTDTVDVSYPLRYYSHLCGFPVHFRLAGRIDSDLFYDASGSVVREVDTQPGAVQTFSSPYASFSFPFASTLVTTYHDGAAVGAPAVATGAGLGGKVPGIPADAGRITYQGVVVDLSPSGIPIVAFTGIAGFSGHSNDPAAADAAICNALHG
jgi:hypothetical protein